jgi:hypothetical protein
LVNSPYEWANSKEVKMKVLNIKCLMAVLVAFGLQGSVRADENYPLVRSNSYVHADDFFFPVGIGISSGHIDVFDKIKDLYRSAGFQINHSTLVPVGITFSPYYEFNCGVGVGLSLGPTAFFEVREETGGFNNNGQGGGQGQGQFGQGQGQFGQQQGTHSVDRFSYIVPVGADVRYTFLRCCDVSPYVKVGVRYPIAGGDNLGDGCPGPYGGVGVELFRRHGIAGGLEFGYDASRVRVNGPSGLGGTSKVTFSGFTGSLYILF